jgi:hypothetical protein
MMVDMSAISVLSISLNTAINIAKAMVDVRDATIFQGKVFELQRAIIDAQQNIFAANAERSSLIEEIREAKAQIASLEAWNTEKQRYVLKDVGSGSLAYAVKESMRNGEPAHHICAACYQHGHKSILQPKAVYPDRTLYCSECKAQIFTGVANFGGV